MKYIGSYLDEVGDKPFQPDVAPGFLQECMPNEAPFEAATWTTIMEEVDQIIMKGVKVVFISSEWFNKLFTSLSIWIKIMVSAGWRENIIGEDFLLKKVNIVEMHTKFSQFFYYNVSL